MRGLHLTNSNSCPSKWGRLSVPIGIRNFIAMLALSHPHNCIEQRLVIHRFAKKELRAQVACALARVVVIARGNDNDGNLYTLFFHSRLYLQP